MSLSPKGIARALFASAAGTGLVLAAMHVPGAVALGPRHAPDTTRPGETTTVRDSTLVCPGPELRGVQAVKDHDVGVTVSAAAAPERALTGVDLAAGAGSLTITGMPGASPAAKVTGRGLVATAPLAGARGAGAPLGGTPTAGKPLAGPSWAAVGGTDSLAPGVAAAQSWLVTSGEDRSLGMVACGSPSAESWLLAGGGQPGRQERLVLTNPGDNAVSVDVTMLGAKGPVKSPTGLGIVVPARARTSVLLDSISGTETAPVVHVVAQGGLVTAVLNDYWLDGTVPAGSDDTVPAAAPSRDQVIPAVSVVGAARLRVAVPGDAETVVQARVLTAQGPRALPRDGVVRVAGGTVRDIDLTGLAAGTYAIQVRADHPVVAGAMVQRRNGSAAGDLAWSTSTGDIRGVAGLPLTPPAGAPGPVGHLLSLASSGDDTSVEVVTTDATGKVTSQRLSVPADSTLQVGLTGVTSVWVHRVSGAGHLRAGVVSWFIDRSGALISTTPLADTVLRTTSAGLLQVGD